MPLKSEKYLQKNTISEALENGISETGVMPIDGGVVVSDKVFLEEGIRKPRCRGRKLATEEIVIPWFLSLIDWVLGGS